MAKLTVTTNGRKAREQRAVVGATQDEIAQLCGVTRQHISKIENSDRIAVGNRVFKHLCLALRVERNELLAPPASKA